MLLNARSKDPQLDGGELLQAAVLGLNRTVFETRPSVPPVVRPVSTRGILAVQVRTAETRGRCVYVNR